MCDNLIVKDNMIEKSKVYRKYSIFLQIFVIIIIDIWRNKIAVKLPMMQSSKALFDLLSMISIDSYLFPLSMFPSPEIIIYLIKNFCGLPN